MRKARILRNELNLWKVAWQQIETFLQRIDSARKQDQPHQRRCEGLLRGARAVEHQRRLFGSAKALSDPIVDRLPDRWYNAEAKTGENLSPAQVWSLPFRRWRIPGTDELELAVGNLLTSDGEVAETVVLKADLDFGFDMRFSENDPLVRVRLPTYPGAAAGRSIVPADVNADITESDGPVSLFSRDARKAATLNETGDEEPVGKWSVLCAARRAAPDEVVYVGPGGGPPWSASLVSRTQLIVNQVRSNIADDPDETTAVQWLLQIAQAASGAAQWVDDDQLDLMDARQALEEEGAKDKGLPGFLGAAADRLGRQKEGFETVARYAQALGSAIGPGGLGRSFSSSVRQNQLTQAASLKDAVDKLSGYAVDHELFRPPVESGRLQPELDAAFSARLTYPDGTLRLVRALEWMFLASWPARRRWFRLRYADMLTPLFEGFRKPFISGLKALVNGGDTGLPCSGLTLEEGTAASVGCETIITGHPASMIGSLDDIETGHIGIIAGDRPAAAVILGMSAQEGKLAFNISPLRVSVDSQPPGTAGLVAGGQTIACHAPGLTAAELRSGESAAGAAADGPLHETVALWSRLALVFGWLTIERELRDNEALTDDAYHGLMIPEPSTRPLHALGLFGTIPSNTLSIAIRGVPDDYWEAVDGERRPRIARPGEMLLLSGLAKPQEEGQSKPEIQAAVEVESVYRTTGDMLARMHAATLAQLATSPLNEEEHAACKLICGPQEDIVMIVLRRTWLRKHTLVENISLRRDFKGVDLPSLAAEALLPEGFINDVVLAGPVGDAGKDREGEFLAAGELLAAWTRYAHSHE